MPLSESAVDSLDISQVAAKARFDIRVLLPAISQWQKCGCESHTGFHYDELLKMTTRAIRWQLAPPVSALCLVVQYTHKKN